MEENTQKALDSAISQIEKDHGKGVNEIKFWVSLSRYRVISTGSLTLDTVWVRGLPKGRE